MGRLEDKLKANLKVFTCEVTPPKGPGTKRFLRYAEQVGPHVDAINLTDSQRAVVRMSSLAASKILLDEGYEPVCQLTCRDRNSIGLQADLMGAGALGVENILCLTGDPVKVGDCPNAKPVFEFETLSFLKMVGELQNQRDAGGNKMNRRTQFFVGAVVNPTLRSESQYMRMQKKIEFGARFFQTQGNYDIPDFVSFLKKVQPLNAKVLAGILLLHSYEVACYIHKNIPGITVPDSVLETFRTSKDPQQTGIDFAVDTMVAVAPYCAGFHLMTIRNEELIPRLKETYDQRTS